MAARHDYECEDCAFLCDDLVVMHGQKVECPECGGDMEITYAYWDDLQVLGKGQCTTDKVDSEGNVRHWHAKDDPLCLIEAGLKKSGGMRTTTAEQAREIRQMMLLGDSDKVRHQVLQIRKENQALRRGELSRATSLGGT